MLYRYRGARLKLCSRIKTETYSQMSELIQLAFMHPDSM